MKIHSLAEANEVLKNYVPAARKYREAVVSLENMRTLMHGLGDPQEEFKVIHVAGSSGKTSTAYYVASLLKASGKKVGLTVSPHIDDVNERVQINLTPLEEKEFCTSLSTFLGVVRTINVQPTYFELLVAFAYWYFKKAKVDYAVIEVGLGGLLDATNVVMNPQKVCIITDIGLDHTEILGHTVGEIASQKAGIIQGYNLVFCYQQDDEIMSVIREIASQQRAELHEIQPIKAQDMVENLPLFQQRNWYLAFCVYEFLAARDTLKSLSSTQLAHTTATYVPARMETISYQGKTIIMDGAHNPQKMHEFVRSVQRMYPNTQIAGLVSLLKAKSPKVAATLKELLPLLSHAVITSFDTQQDMRKLSLDPVDVVGQLESQGYKSWTTEPDPLKGLQKVLKRPEKIIVITGSFYLLNHIRPLLHREQQ